VADALGVSHFVAKPSDPEVLLATVEEALAVGPNKPAAAPSEQSHRDYIRTVSAKLTDKVKELEAVEAALQGSEARYRSLSEFSPVGVFALDREGRVTYTNPKLREICDLPADGSALAWTELVHADDRDRVVTALATAARDRVPYRDRVKITPLTRAMRWTDIQATPVVSNGEQSGFVGTMEDVTVAVLASDQSQELEARRQAEHIEIRLISMLDAMADALVCVDGQGRIVLVNAQTERLFGYRREELAGQPVEILLPDALRDRHPVLRARYVALPHPRPMGEGLELWARRRDGSTFRVEISLSAIDRGSEMLVMANVRDITGWLELRAERDRLMAQLEQQPRQPG